MEGVPPINPFNHQDGRGLVGYDVAPGTYRATPTATSGDFAALTARDGFGSVIDIVSTEANAGVTLKVTADMVFLDWIGNLERVN